MQTLQALIMGTVQGLTEFLPVSSSGHIVLTSALYKLLTGASFDVVNFEEIFFDILIHLATLFAVIIYFFKDIKKIFSGFFKSLVKKDFQNEDFKFFNYIMFTREEIKKLSYCKRFINCHRVCSLYFRKNKQKRQKNEL